MTKSTHKLLDNMQWLAEQKGCLSFDEYGTTMVVLFGREKEIFGQCDILGCSHLEVEAAVNTAIEMAQKKADSN